MSEEINYVDFNYSNIYFSDLSILPLANAS